METFEWQILEYPKKERPQDWYWAVAVISGAFAIAAFIFANLILAILIVLAGGTLVLLALKDPDTLNIEITSRGVRVNNKIHPFPIFDSFWVEDELEEIPLLILKSEQVYSTLILVPVAEEIDLEELREYLLENLDEEELSVPTSRKILEFLGF